MSDSDDELEEDSNDSDDEEEEEEEDDDDEIVLFLFLSVEAPVFAIFSSCRVLMKELEGYVRRLISSIGSIVSFVAIATSEWQVLIVISPLISSSSRRIRLSYETRNVDNRKILLYMRS